MAITPRPATIILLPCSSSTISLESEHATAALAHARGRQGHAPPAPSHPSGPKHDEDARIGPAFTHQIGSSRQDRFLAGSSAGANLVKEHTVRCIIKSTCMSLDGVSQDPQNWPGNGTYRIPANR